MERDAVTFGVEEEFVLLDPATLQTVDRGIASSSPRRSSSRRRSASTSTRHSTPC
jgi:gamma-glutamyl:cysteine ligase YbdK (ATP-grasp superfamily)